MLSVTPSRPAAISHARRVRPLWWAAVLLPLVLGHAADAGSLASIAPSGVTPGQSIEITGTGFDANGANNSVTFTPAAGAPLVAEAASIATLDATTGLRRLTVTVPATLAVGRASLRVTNRATGEAIESRALEIVSLEIGDTTSGPPGSAGLVVRIQGSENSRFANSSRVSFGPGITVRSIAVDSAASLRATIDVASIAAIGSRDVTVISPTQRAVAARAFSVVAPTPTNHAPIAKVNGPYSGEAGLPVAFSAIGSSDPDNDALTFAWSFGDGSTGSGAAPMHAFAAQGTFTITLTVTDAHGSASQETTTAVVSAAADRAPPVVTLSAPAEALPGAQVLVTAGASDNVGVTAVTFEVDGANATQATTTPYQRTVDIPALAAPGTKVRVTATARDGAGNAGSSTASIAIVAAPDTTAPAVTIALPPETAPGATIRVTAAAADDGGVRGVVFSSGGQAFGSDDVAPYEATFAVPAGASPGSSISFVARATDFAGNVGDSAGTVLIVATPDTTPPTVALTAPPQAREGGLVHLQATASDNVTVASVTFFVDGVAIATDLSSPFETDFVVPSTQPAGAVLQLRAVATDSSNLQASSDGQVTIVAATTPTGSGLITGEVYDDATSLPLAGASVSLAGADASGQPYDATATTDARGRYVLAANSGHGTVRITRAGWSRVDRAILISDGAAVESIDARLTAAAGAPETVPAVIGATLTRGDAATTIEAGALANDTALSLVAITAQGLQGLLPAGWSPVGAFDLLPHGVAFNGPQTVTLVNRAQVPIGAPLVFATWDESASAWRAVQSGAVGSDGSRLSATVSSSGQFSWLLADASPAAPPAPADGAIVAGVIAATVPDAATADVTPQPRILFYKPGITSRVTSVLHTDAPVSSGTLLRSRISESYRFTSGAEIGPEPFVEDIVFFRNSAEFVVTPSQTFEPAAFQQGVITVEMRAPSSSSEQPVIGAQGGVVSASTGEQLAIAAGSSGGSVAVTLEGLTSTSLGASLPSELSFLGGAAVGFAGAAPASAVLSIPRDAQRDDSGLLVLLRLVDLDGATRLLLVGRGTVAGTRIVSDVALPGVSTPLDGVSGAGRYVFARVTTPVGFLTGTVTGTSGLPVAGALVSAGGWPTVSLSLAARQDVNRAAGQYVALATVGTASITARDLATRDGAAAQAVIAAANAVVATDLRLAAQVPTVTSVTPADGAANVGLSAAIAATFSEPIDPASATGSGAGAIVVSAPGGAVVSGALTLSAGNTKATFRASSPLAPNTAYTVTVTAGFRNLGGHGLAAPVVAHFTSVDTSAPAPPPAGSITARIPDADGFTTITGTQGTAGVHDVVSIVNVTRRTSFPVLVDPNGGFSARMAAGRGDTLQIVITGQNGTQTVVPLPAFTQTNADGSIATVVNSAGGRVAGPQGSAIDVPAGALPDGTVVTIQYLGEAAFPVKLTADQKNFFEFTGGVRLDFGGATPSAYVNVSLATTGTETRADRWIVGQVATVNGRQVFNVADTAHVIDGRITTSSPPCPGVQAAAAYGFVKTAKRFTGIAVGYGRFSAPGLDPDPFNTQILSWTQPSLGAISPFDVLATPSPVDVCMPILSGRVTVSSNSQKIVIPANQLTPADREIIVRNLTVYQTFHYPRNVAEFRFLVSGTTDDTYVVSIVTGGQQQQVTPEISDGPAGFVNVRLDMDKLTTSVSEVIVRNISKNPVVESHFPQSAAAVKIPVSGGAGDAFDVSVVDAAGNERTVTFTVESPGGAGNLVATALPVTIDPGTDVFLERFDGATRVSRDQIPADQVHLGGFTYVFTGDALNETFRVEVVYHDGRPSDVIAIPNVVFTVSDIATGRVIKTFNALVPPPDEPFNLGSVSGDTQWPILTGTPPFLNNFDPSSPLTFTFSEGIDRDSASRHFNLFDDDHHAVRGQIRMSNENRTITFVPDAPLKLGAHYTLELELLADGSGNFMGTTEISISTFSPKPTGPTFTADGQLGALRDLTFFKEPTVDGGTKTIGVGLSGDLGTDRSIVTLDFSNPDAPSLVGSMRADELQRLFVVPGVQNLQTRGDNPCGGGRSFGGDLLLASSYTTAGSAIQFYDLNSLQQPCRVGGKLLTANPATLSGQSGVVLTSLGFPRTVTALPNGPGWLSYTAVENVGVMMVDVGGHIPTVAPADRVREPMIAGNYTDLAAVQNTLLAVERTNPSLDLLDRNLTLLSSTDLPLQEAIVVKYVEAVPIDADENGQIAQEELRNLAFVGGVGGVAIVDVTDLGVPFLAGSVPMRGAVFELEFDEVKRRLFAGGPTTLPNGDWAVSLIDLSSPDPFTQLDRDNDGADDRVVWRTPAGQYGLGNSLYRAMRFDPESRLLYVGITTGANGTGGLDTWAFDNRCCDLGVDFVAKPTTSAEADAGDADRLLRRDKRALQIGLAAGFAAAESCGPVIRPAGAAPSADSVSIIEQGSGACIWKDNPLDACGNGYVPGTSDHDFEVFIPATFFDGDGPMLAAQCVVRALSLQFVDEDGTPKPIDVDGEKVTFPDVTFFPVDRDQFEAAELDVLPPKSSGRDDTGDLGLGRQQLLLKWLLEGEYITVPGYDVAGASLETLLTTLRTATKISAVEGLEWSTLQKFALAKSTAFLRIRGAATLGSSLHDVYVAQLHDTGKAGIRAALARMVADDAAREMVLSSSRSDYASGACRNIKSGVPPEEWNPKRCGSFEEYVASAAARTLDLPNPIFTASDVSDTIHWFYRVKTDVSSGIPTEEVADTFVRTAALFIDNAVAKTKPVYDERIVGDPQSVRRQDNLARAKSLTTFTLANTTLAVLPHAFNHGFVGVAGVQLSYFRGTEGPGVLVKSVPVDLPEAADIFPRNAAELAPQSQDGLSPEDRALLDLEPIASSYKKALFMLGNADPDNPDPNNPPIDLGSDQGQPHYVAFTIDLPDKKAREANRANNYFGFWYYVLDRDDPAAVPPAVPPIPLPLADPDNDLLKPNPECVPEGELKVTQSITFPGVPVEQTGPVQLVPNEAVTYNIDVVNGAGIAVNDVTVCSSLIPSGNNCLAIANLAPGEHKKIPIPYAAPAGSQIIESVATVRAPQLGVRQSAPMRVMVGCETEAIVPVEDDPNPTAADAPSDPGAPQLSSPADPTMVMRGGKALRYYQVVDRKSGVPIPGAQVDMTVTRPNAPPETTTLTADERGRLVFGDDDAVAISIGTDLKEGDEVGVTLALQNAVAYCHLEQQFVVKVADRIFLRTWNGGGSIAAEGTIEIGVQGKIGSGLSMVLTDIADKGHQTLSFGRTDTLQGGLLEKILETGAKGTLGPVTTEAIFSIKGGVLEQLTASDQHDFGFPSGSSQLAQTEAEAFGGLLLSSLMSTDPLGRRLLESIAEQIVPIAPYTVSEMNAVGLEGSLRPKLGTVTGYRAQKSGKAIGDIDYGFEASVGASGTIGFTLSLDDRPKANELVPSFEAKGSIDLSGALGLGSGGTVTNPNTGKKKLSIVEKLKIGFLAGIAGSIKGSLTVDATTRQPKKLVFAFSTPKKFGWIVGGASGGGQTDIVSVDGGGGIGDKVTIKFTITDPALIAKFLAAVHSLGGLAFDAAKEGGVPVLGLAAFEEDLDAFIDALATSSNITYEVVMENGDAFVFPLGFEIAEAGVSLEIAAGLQLDRLVTFTAEKGVVRGGTLFPLQKYARDEMIPPIPPVSGVDDFKQLGQLAVNAAAKFITASIDVVVQAFSNAINRIKSRHTAEIVFSGANETPFDPAVASFTYTAGPPSVSRPFVMRPESIAGPANVPHYGIGGFHQFLPQDHVFADPATLTVFYNDDEVAGVDESTLGIYRWNTARSDWDYLGGTPDPVANTVTTTVDRMGLYTVAAPMPAGTIALAAQWTAAGTTTEPHTVVTYTSGPLRLNTGQPAPDGTMFTVVGASPAAETTTFGTVVSADEDPQTPGVQVGARGGALQFTIDYPSDGGMALVVAASREGTALTASVTPVRP